LPGPKYNFRGPGGRYYGSKPCGQLVELIERQRFWQAYRKARAQKENIGPFIHGTLHEIVKVGKSHHYVYTDDAIGPGFRLLYLFLQDSFVRYFGIRIPVGFGVADSGRGYNADAARSGHGTSQARQRDANSHSSLDYRQIDLQVPDFQGVKFVAMHKPLLSKAQV